MLRGHQFFVLLVALAAGCKQPPRPQPPSRSDTTTTTTAAPEPSPCELAAVLRQRIPKLLSAGKLHRTLRVIDEANLLCPAQQISTWLVELETLAEIGRYDVALALAGEITDSKHRCAKRG